jgi:hypothetical protein
MTQRRLALQLTLVTLCIAEQSSLTMLHAHGRLPKDVPIDRLIQNLDARLSTTPDDANLQYILGRLHALAYESKSDNVPVWMNDRPDRTDPLAGGFSPPETKYWVAHSLHGEEERNVPSAVELREHLREAIVHLSRAIALAPAVASYRLALASILESGEPLAREIDVIPLRPEKGVDESKSFGFYELKPEKFESDSEYHEDFIDALHHSGFGSRGPCRRDSIVLHLLRDRDAADQKLRALARDLLVDDWREQIIGQYFIAFALALPTEGAEKTQPLRGWETIEALIAYEAGTEYVRIVTARGARPEDAVRLATAKAANEAFKGLPPNPAITPIIFSLADTRPLSDLLERGASTTFDLDGFGQGQHWPWVAPDTGILVWDPLRTGRITSGRQLFGSVSWWLFFQNGYDALAALDDDGDGELGGRELDGLAAWFDKNGDGRSDPGEVIPVGELAIAGLSCRATGTSGESPCNPLGLRLDSGAILPTYDWIAHPLPEPTPRTSIAKVTRD